MNYKPFSQPLYDKNDDAKLLVLQWLQANNIVAWINPDQYGIDLLSFDRSFEVEVKHNWKGETFPYASVHLPGRKIKFANSKSMFVMLNSDRSHALLVDGGTVAESPQITKNTVYSDGETFIEIDVSKCGLVKVVE